LFILYCIVLYYIILYYFFYFVLFIYLFFFFIRIIKECLKLYEKLLDIENIQTLNELFINYCESITNNCKIEFNKNINIYNSVFDLNDKKNIIWLKKVIIFIKYLLH